jgi:signal transduction histidine kinase
MRFAKPMRLTNSLNFKVLLAYVVGVVLSIILLTLAGAAVLVWQSDRLLSSGVVERARMLANHLVFDDAGVPVRIGDNNSGKRLGWLLNGLSRQSAYRVIDEAGIVVLHSPTGDLFGESDNASGYPRRGRYEFEHAGVMMYGASEPVVRNGRTWFVQFAASRQVLEIVHREFAFPFMVVGISAFSLVLLFVFGACAYVTLRYTLRPLRMVSDSAASISPHSLHARLPVGAVPAEIVPLVSSFNHALERLERGYRIQQEFIATAAHELKTPLTLIHMQVELMEESDARDALLGDVKHMTRQVQQLLHLAEVSEAQNYNFTSVDVLDVAREAVSYLQRMADTMRVRLILSDHSAGTRWDADRGALFTLLKNLMENAIQHAPPGTAVQVDINGTSVTVRDWGPGVSPNDLNQMFTRFWRSAHRRDHSAGLGLSICQEIATAHGWTLTAQRAEPGVLVRVERNETGLGSPS